MKKTVRKYSRWLILLAAAVLLIIYFAVPAVNGAVNEAMAVLGSANLDKVAAYIRSFGAYAVAFSFCLMVFSSLIAPLPAFLITLSNAAAFTISEDEAHSLAVLEQVKGHGYSDHQIKQMLKPDAVRGTSGSSMEAIISRFVPEADAAAVREAAYAMAHEKFMAGVPKKPGLDELLAYLAGEGIPLAVASSSSLEMIERHLANGGVRSYFSQLVSGVGMEHPKPAPDIFLKTAEAMGVEPARALVLEDSLSGVRAGVAGGFVTVMVPDLVAPDDFARTHAAAICQEATPMIGISR